MNRRIVALMIPVLAVLALFGACSSGTTSSTGHSIPVNPNFATPGKNGVSCVGAKWQLARDGIGEVAFCLGPNGNLVEAYRPIPVQPNGWHVPYCYAHACPGVSRR